MQHVDSLDEREEKHPTVAEKMMTWIAPLASVAQRFNI
jgi:hypothetical protein